MKNAGFVVGLFVAIAASSCSVSTRALYQPGVKYSPAQLQHDFSVLRNILEANHPSLYWYTPKDSIDFFFALTANKLHDSLTEIQFRNRIAWALSKIRCGHTNVRPSVAYTHFYSSRKLPQFPLLLKVWKDSAVVISNLNRKAPEIKRGTVITSIDHRNVKDIIDSIAALMGTDGYSMNFKYQVISFNFPAFYKNTFGLDSIHRVEYLDSTNHRKEVLLENYIPKNDTLVKKEGFIEPLTHRQLRQLRLSANRNLQIDTALSSAYLSVNTFSGGRLYRFFRKSFKKIRQEHIKNLVVDLRLNTGGSVLSCTKLSSYLVDKPFNVADTVAAINRSFPGKKYIKPWLIYWLSMHVSGRKSKLDNRIYFRYFEKHKFNPKRKDHFGGNIYLLTGGYTFSAATLVASNLKGQNNVTLVGEETGGGAYGNSAMHLTSIVLPHSKIRVTLPLFRMVLRADRPKNGRGVMPDVEVIPSSVTIRNGIDAKVEAVKQLIIRNAKKGAY